MTAPDNAITNRADEIHGPHYDVLLTPETVLDFLSDRPGAANGLTARELVNALCGFSTAFGERRLRRVVVALCEAGHPICTNPEDGYFLAATPEEVNAACEFLIQRAMTSLRRAAAMRKVALPELLGQLSLPMNPSDTTTPRKTP